MVLLLIFPCLFQNFIKVQLLRMRLLTEKILKNVDSSEPKVLRIFSYLNQI